MTPDDLFEIIDPAFPSEGEPALIFETPVKAVRAPKKEKHAIRRVDTYYKWLKFWNDEVTHITTTYDEKKMSDVVRERLVYCRLRAAHYKKLIKRYRAK